MDDSLEISNGQSPFEQIKRVGRSGKEYWSGCELATALGYVDWSSFQKVIQRAQIACERSGFDLRDHFRDATEVVQTSSGADRRVLDTFLSRYGCYLVAMNADPREKMIAEAQTYFAFQARRQEELDQLTEDQRRIYHRERVKSRNAILNNVAHQSGVEDFDEFQDAGYTGLYGGYDAKNLKRLKKIPAQGELLDHMGREELAANEFRITQTETKLRAMQIQTEREATDTHHQVGKKVRKAIEDIGGIMPEKLPSAPDIRGIIRDPANTEFAMRLAAPTHQPEMLRRPTVSIVPKDAKWKDGTPVVVVGVAADRITEDGTGYQNFPNLETAREVFADLDTHKAGPRFTQAIGNPQKDKMRFETWRAFELYDEKSQ